MLGEKKGCRHQNSYSVSPQFPFPFTYKNVLFHLPFLKDKANNDIFKRPLFRIIVYQSWEATQRHTSSTETMWALDGDHPGPSYILSSEPQPPHLWIGANNGFSFIGLFWGRIKWNHARKKPGLWQVWRKWWLLITRYDLLILLMRKKEAVTKIHILPFTPHQSFSRFSCLLNDFL